MSPFWYIKKEHYSNFCTFELPSLLNKCPRTFFKEIKYKIVFVQEFSFCFRFDEKSHLNWTIAMSQHRIEYFDEASSVPKVFFLFHLISLALSFVSTPISQHSRHSIYISTVSS